MGRISYEDKMRIQTLHEQGLGAKAIRSRYPAKQWSLNTLKTICRHITKTAKISSNCAEHRCCRWHDLPWRGPARYEQKVPSDCQNAWNKRHVRSAHRENWSRVVSYSAHASAGSQRCRVLLRRLTVNKVKQLFFTDEKKFLSEPSCKQVSRLSNFINFHSSWKFCLHFRRCNRDIHACWVAKLHFQVQTAVTFFTFEFFNTIFIISCNTYWQ